MKTTDETGLRLAMVKAAQRLYQRKLNGGTAGNISVRCGKAMLVTPSGVHADALAPEMMVKLDLDGQILDENAHQPTSEWRLHRDMLTARPDMGAVVHTHAIFATTLACLHKDIPPFHYMIAVAGGDTIRCAPYALFGTQALSDHALAALTDRNACLLAHHGMIALGRDLDHALAVTEEVETLCEQYWRILQLGEPKMLSSEQMSAVLERFKAYGQWKAAPSPLQKDISDDTHIPSPLQKDDAPHTNIPSPSQKDTAPNTNIPSPLQGEG